MAKETPDSQELHEQLERAKETLSRLRNINGCTSTCCKTSKTCQGCRGHKHDITIGKCSERDGKCSGMSRSKSGASLRESRGESNSDCQLSRVDYSKFRVDSHAGHQMDFSRADLERLHSQINSLEERVRGPIMSYVDSMERRHEEMSTAVETIRRQLLNHERVCPSMGSAWFHNGPDAWANGNPQEKFARNQRAGRESRMNAEALEKELKMYREKLERSETKVKELLRSLSQCREASSSTGFANGGDVLLQAQLQRQQQLAEGYFKESTSKDREISFLTIEKYNLESEMNSLVSDLESANKKRNEMSQEKQRLEIALQECSQRIANLERQLSESKSQLKRARTEFRGVLEEERARGEKNSENQTSQENEVRELRRKIKKYEERHSSLKANTRQMEIERDELLMKVKSLHGEYKIKLSECERLKEENHRLTKEISGAQVEASMNKSEYKNSKTYNENLKAELLEAKNMIKILQSLVQESKEMESKSSTEISAFTHKEASLRVLIDTAEKERMSILQVLQQTKERETVLKNEVIEFKDNLEKARVNIHELTQNFAIVKTELEQTRDKYLQLKKFNDELVFTNDDVQRSHDFTVDELKLLRASYDELTEKQSQSSADLKAYKRIVGERESQLKKVELDLAEIHKIKDRELKDILKKDREIAFLKARITSMERRVGSRDDGPALLSSGNQNLQDAEIYLERIVELESDCKAHKSQIDELQKSQHHAKKKAQKSDLLKEELASRDEEVQRVRREMSQSRQTIEDLRVKAGQMEMFRDEKEKLQQEVARLQAKSDELSVFKQACEQKEEEVRVLKRMTSEEADLEGKLSRLKDRCREKDEEIEELHQKVITLQVKMKDFMHQNSLIEEQMRNVRDKYSLELSEKEKITQALKNAEKKCESTDIELDEAKSRITTLEKQATQTKRLVEGLESEKDETALDIAKVEAEREASKEEIANLRQQVEDLEQAASKALEEAAARDNEELPDGASTPMDNSLGDSLKFSLGRSGRNSVAIERLDVLEEENVQLLNKQGELEDELYAAEEHAEELKNALKAKREDVNELHVELDTMKEKVKMAEKARMEFVDENETLQHMQSLLQQKIDDLRASNERHMDESDEVEKALTVAEEKIENLEKKLEEVSGRCANSEGQLQSVTERLTRKDKELAVVETQVDEQRKLCDGYKASAERLESLVEKLRVEKGSADETLMAIKLEMAKKEGAYKVGKEKLSEAQTRLYETEDKLTGNMNECKKLGRENERLKREIKELETKVSDLQSMKKKQMSVEVENASGPLYNTKFVTLNTSVKDNAQNVEGLDNKLNSAQNKISTLEVALAHDLRRFSLRRTSSSDSRRGGYSPSELSPSTARRPRSSSSVNSDVMDDMVSSPYPKAESSTSFGPDVDHTTGEELDVSSKADIKIKIDDDNFVESSLWQEEDKLDDDTEEIDLPRAESSSSFGPDMVYVDTTGEALAVSDKLGDDKEETGHSQTYKGETNHSENTEDEDEDVHVESSLFAADPFLSSILNQDVPIVDDSSNIIHKEDNDSEAVEACPTSDECANMVEEHVTCCSASVTGHSATLPQEDWNQEEEGLIYF